MTSALLLGLGGCRTSPPIERAPPLVAAQPFEKPREARLHRVVAAESLLTILVYRGGAMARLGHNHVIASHHLEGEVYLTTDPAATRFEIRIPVNELSVDEPELRAEAGPDFLAEVPQNARDGTRRNLLSAALLDGANHPVIRLRATSLSTTVAGYEAAVEIALRDQVRTVRVPMTVERGDGVLRARGEFPLRQSQLGLEPFSVAMGTLVVVDEMKVRFDVTARM